MSSATICYMPKTRKPTTTTVRIDADLAQELDVIADYFSDTQPGSYSTIGSLIADWVKPHITKYRQKAIDHRIEKLRKMKESG